MKATIIVSVFLTITSMMDDIFPFFPVYFNYARRNIAAKSLSASVGTT